MECYVNHRDFIKNKISLQVSPTKIQIKYNNKTVKGTRGKYLLKDDNNREREIKIVDYVLISPFITVDKNEKIPVLPKIPMHILSFLLPIILMIRFGIIGWATSLITFFYVRNIFIDSEKSLIKRYVQSFVALIILYLVLFFLTYAVLYIAKK